MTDRLTQIEQRAQTVLTDRTPDEWGYGYEHMGDMWRDLAPMARDTLALVEIAKAAREVSRIEATGVLPDFMPLAIALNQLDET